MKTRLPAFSAIVLLVTICSANFQARSQDKKSGDDVIKISAELVQVDVTVTDKNHQPVRGLKRGDFELYDNGKLQNLTTFAFEENRSRRIEADPELSRSLPKAIAVGELKRAVAFVVDTLHMKPENLYRTQKMLEDFIDKKMEAGDLVLILPTAGGSGLFQQFTADARLLHRAVNRLRPFLSNNETRRTNAVPPSVFNVPGRGGNLGQSPFNNPDPLEEFDVRSTLSTLNNVIQSLGKLPGRKLGVFVSEGFRPFKTQTTLDISDTTTRAQRANVIFYSIDPKGLESDGLSAADDVAAKDLSDVLEERREDKFETESALTAIAVDTGGKFYRNSNDIKRGIDDLLQINATYYLLGFQPEEGKWDGKYHKLKVAVRGRPDLLVATRKGYSARNEKKDNNKITNPKVAEVIEAITSPLVRRDLDLQLTPFYRDNAKREPATTMLLHIDATRLNFKPLDGYYKTELEVIGFIFDSQGKQVENYRDVISLNLLPKTYEDALKRGLLSMRSLTLKPGVYQMRVFVRESESGLIGTANNFIEIPNLKSDRLAISSIFTTAQGLDDKGASNASTLSQRRYPRNSQLDYVYIIYNARSENNAPQLEVRVRVMQGRSVQFNSQPKPVEAMQGSTPPGRIISGGSLLLKNLPSGDYTLEVIVKDKLEKKSSRAIVRQEIDFSIE
ncbi:MAG: VWA domain-containing protein [Acidobacteria bacterium]|nr:VWA domain-containing protein [Acidobacteriota bacterium]